MLRSSLAIQTKFNPQLALRSFPPTRAFTCSAFQLAAKRKMAATATPEVNKSAHAFERGALEGLLIKRFFFAPAFEIYGGAYSARLGSTEASHLRRANPDNRPPANISLQSRRCQGIVRLWTPRFVAAGQHY